MFKKKAKKVKPLPLGYKPWKNPLKFAATKMHMLSMAAIGTYVGVLIVAALYYLITQTTGWTNHTWENLVGDSDTRHMIRNVGEGLLGGLLGQALIFNHFKRAKDKKRNILDKLEIKLHIPNVKDGKWASPWVMVLTPLFCLAYAIPGYLLGTWLVHEMHSAWHWFASDPMASGWLDRSQMVFTSDYDEKIVGYGAAFFFGRRPARGVMDDIQEYLVTYRISNEGKLRWYHSPTYKARFNYLMEKGIDKQVLGSWQSKLIRGGVAVGVLLAAYGYFILNWVAFGLVNQDTVNKYTNISVIALLVLSLISGTSLGAWLHRRRRKLQEQATNILPI